MIMLGGWDFLSSRVRFMLNLDIFFSCINLFLINMGTDDFAGKCWQKNN